jgi:hypothetical protein
MTTTHEVRNRSDIHSGLTEELSRVNAILKAHREGTGPDSTPARSRDLPVLDDLEAVLAMTGFERDLLMLTAAVDLDGSTASEVSRLVDSSDPRPTPGFALACLPDAHWDAFLPESPLRAWKLIELSGEGPIAARRLAIDERVLHHLLGLSSLDQRLSGVASPIFSEDHLTASQLEIADRVLRLIQAQEIPVTIHLTGEDPSAMRAMATGLVLGVGGTPVQIISEALPRPGPALHDIIRLIDREWVLSRRLPVAAGGADDPSLTQFLETTAVPVLVVIGQHPSLDTTRSNRLVVHQRVPMPSPSDQRVLWHQVLNGQRDKDVDLAIEDVSQGHRLSANAIVGIARQMSARGEDVTPDRLRAVCRVRSRIDIEPYAQLISSRAGWDDLVLPTGHLETLRDIVRQVRSRATVYERWGFADRTARGLGVTALFSGESGTGKTLAAEIIANDLGLDLYRVDLAATVSKYIGETEKNLSRLFSAAESSGAVLLFDEADALFGKRTEVRDSHDRYANMEIAYLLQRMEAYRGLAILTTNLRANLDRAFTRRLRFVVQFPFPDETHRAEIWRRVFPTRTPLEGVDPTALARLTIPGGSIWSIALSAAFAAAESGTPVTPRHLLQAAHTEYAKTDRTLTDTELAALQ